MTELVTYQVLLRVPADKVFACLVRVVTDHGRLHEVEGYGTALTFTPDLADARDARSLRAQVHRGEDGTTLCIEPTDGDAPRRPAARRAEQHWVGATIASVCDHFDEVPLIAQRSPAGCTRPPEPRTGEA